MRTTKIWENINQLKRISSIKFIIFQEKFSNFFFLVYYNFNMLKVYNFLNSNVLGVT